MHAIPYESSHSITREGFVDCSLWKYYRFEGSEFRGEIMRVQSTVLPFCWKRFQRERRL